MAGRQSHVVERLNLIGCLQTLSAKAYVVSVFPSVLRKRVVEHLYIAADASCFLDVLHCYFLKFLLTKVLSEVSPD